MKVLRRYRHRKKPIAALDDLISVHPYLIESVAFKTGMSKEEVVEAWSKGQTLKTKDHEYIPVKET